MFNDKQNQVLSYELDPSRIKLRDKGNMQLAYLEGFDIIDTANKIFGFGNWSYSVSSLEQVSQETNSNQNIVICYKAVVSLVIHDLNHSKHISREDVGFGTGIAKTLADAHEGGAKEAVTDAVKRAFRSCGNQFGNSLYDKSRNAPNQPQPQQQPHSNRQSTPMQKQQVHYDNAVPQNYDALYKLGLSIAQHDNNLIITGDSDEIFAKKDSIKAFGFRWDGRNKCWYKPLEQMAA